MDEDPRPRVAVAAFFGVMRVTGQLWGRGRESGVDSLRALTEVYLDQLGPALVEQLAYGIRRDGRVAARGPATPLVFPPGVPYASAARHDRLHNSGMTDFTTAVPRWPDAISGRRSARLSVRRTTTQREKLDAEFPAAE